MKKWKQIFNLSSWSHWFCSLWSKSRRAWSKYLDYFHFTHFKIYLYHFYFDNIDFYHIDLTLILIINIFKDSEWKQEKEETFLWIKYYYSKGFNNITFNHLNLFDQFKKIIVWLHLITLEILMNYIWLISINLISLIT